MCARPVVGDAEGGCNERAGRPAGRPLMERLQRWGNHPAGPVLLVALAVLEATVFPAPTEAMLIALVLALPRRAAAWTALATAGSVAGGVLGYLAGATLLEAWGPVLEWSGSSDWLRVAADLYRDNYALALTTSGFTPIPYLVYTAAAGAAEVPLPAFVAFSLVGRGAKYAAVAALAWVLGPAVRGTLERLGPRVAVAVTLAIVAAYLFAWR